MTIPAFSAEHAAKVRACLDILQEAQNLCDTAAQELCPVPGFASEWSNLSKAYDAVKKAWYMVATRRDCMSGNARAGKCPCCGKRPEDDATRCARCEFVFPLVNSGP